MVKDGTYVGADVVQRCKPTYASNLVASRGLLSDMEWATATEELILTFPQAHHIIYHEPLKNERSHEGGGQQKDLHHMTEAAISGHPAARHNLG